MAKGKLNQIIAVVQGKKSRASKLLTDSHRGWNKDAISGIEKNYRPKADDGDPLPAESKRIHLNVPERIRDTMDQVASFFDVVMTQEAGNTQAKATIEVDGKPFLTDMPVTTLLFLEKQLVDLHTFVSTLPTLPPDREWRRDDNRDCYVTDPIESIRTSKQQKPIVLYDATPEHPAQTQIISEDVTVGTWTTTYLSSAIPARQKAEMLRRVEDMQDAVKRAREQANSIEVEQLTHGRRILNHIFGDLLKSNEG
jgi:hypothetical protein